MKLKDKVISSIAVAAFFTLTALVFAPGHLFLTNVTEFNADYFELLGYLLLIAIPVLVLITVALSFLPDKHKIHEKVSTLLFALSFLLWLQGNYIVWNYGLLTGNKIEYNIYFLIFDAAIWVAAFILVWLKSAFFYKYIRFLSCVFIAVQVISTVVMVYNQPVISNSKRYDIDFSQRFTFSQNVNVIVLILDSFQSNAFQKIIDEDDSYKDIFDGFTYYRDAMAGFPTTMCSVPNILTGLYYDNSVPYSKFAESAYRSANSIPLKLKQEGFEVQVFSRLLLHDGKDIASNIINRQRINSNTVFKICDAALFRYLPDIMKIHIYNNGQWFLSNNTSKTTVAKEHVEKPYIEEENTEGASSYSVGFINQMITDAKAVQGKPVFKYYWLNGPHPPYVLNERLEYEEMHGNDGYKRQAMAHLQITKLFLKKMKALGVFDKSMIFIMGDHGIFGDKLQNNANPLLLAKQFNSNGAMKISDAPVSLADIPGTIFNELGLAGYSQEASIFKINESTEHERVFYYYIWNDAWAQDYAPIMREFIVKGPLQSIDSWQATGRKYVRQGTASPIDQPLVEWGPGFHELEQNLQQDEWRWCSSQGILIVNNLSDKTRLYKIKMSLFTHYPEMANLYIAGDILKDNLTINNLGHEYIKEIKVPPGSHIIELSCDAKKVETQQDVRTLVFRIVNLKIEENESASR